MAGRWAIDTNVQVAVLKAEAAVLPHWEEADEPLLPPTVLGEALFGMRNSARAAENEQRLRDAVRWTRLLSVGRAVCEQHATIKLHLKRSGNPIPEADLWIAACSMAEGVPIASPDAHLDQVPGLERDEWRQARGEREAGRTRPTEIPDPTVAKRRAVRSVETERAWS